MIKFVIILVIILIVVGFLIVKINQLDLSKEEDQIRFVQQYGRWLYNAIINVQTITGFIVKQDWGIERKINESTK